MLECPRSRKFADPAISIQWRENSVHDLRGHETRSRESPILRRFCVKLIQSGARAFICREKTLNPEFLEGNILSCAEGGKSSKQPKRRVVPLVIDSQKRWWTVVQIGDAPTPWHVRIAE